MKFDNLLIEDILIDDMLIDYVNVVYESIGLIKGLPIRP